MRLRLLSLSIANLVKKAFIKFTPHLTGFAWLLRQRTQVVDVQTSSLEVWQDGTARADGIMLSCQSSLCVGGDRVIGDRYKWHKLPSRTWSPPGMCNVSTTLQP